MIGSDAEALYKQAVMAELSGVEFLCVFSYDEMGAAYNGIGSASLKEKQRKKLTKWLKLFEPACLIHDMRYEESDGTRKGFDFANKEFRENCLSLANYNYAWWNWKRYVARFVARAMYVAVCTDEAWKMWKKYADKKGF